MRRASSGWGIDPIKVTFSVGRVARSGRRSCCTLPARVRCLRGWRRRAKAWRR
jgi:hypothetical protein